MTHQEIMQTLREAIEERWICRVQMKGEPETRMICPHGVGFSNKDKLMIVCTQIKGFSESHTPASYRNLLYENCEYVELLDHHFTIDPGFNPYSPQYSQWLFHVLKK
jgi:hypothetical protein